MAERDGDFLTRWSRRKRGEPAPGDPETETADSQSGPPSARAQAASLKPDDAGNPDDAGDPEVIAKLPDIDSMEESADFTAFLKAGVPEALKRRAFRRLWRLNPVFAVLDGLNDYDEDFTAGGIIAENIKTIYKVGKGYLDDDDDKPGDKPEDKPGDKPEDEPEDEAEDEAGDAVVEERPPESAEPSDPVEMAQVSQADPEAIPASPVDGDADPAPSKPVRGSALARRWGGSPEKV